MHAAIRHRVRCLAVALAVAACGIATAQPVRQTEEVAGFLEHLTTSNEPDKWHAAGAALLHGHRDIRRDPREGVRWLEKAANAGHPGAMASLGYAYENGLGVVPDRARALELYRKSAAANDAEGQYYLGAAHLSGLAPADAARAYELFSKSAAQGSERGAMALALMYERGVHVPRDERRAVEWLRIAAERRSAAARLELAKRHMQGRGVAKDPAEAARLMRAAAEAGVPEAQLSLGLMYRDAYGGIARDDAEAARWYRRAAELGHAPAQFQLAYALSRGIGVREDAVEAAQWHLRAAIQGLDTAQAAIARRYEAGNGIARDPARAYAWNAIAGKAGNKQGREGAQRLEKTLSPAELEEARRMAGRWREGSDLR